MYIYINFSICMIFRINRELFCEEFPEECVWYKTYREFCNAVPKFCRGKNGPFGVSYFLALLEHMALAIC